MVYSKTSLARQTRLSPRQCLGPISSHAFSLDKPPPSPLALATTLKHRTLCNLTSITRQCEPLNASQHDQRWSCMDAALRPSLRSLRATGIKQKARRLAAADSGS